MSSREVELTLKKQRLRLAGAHLRSKFAYHAEGVAPVCQAADGAVVAVGWMRNNPQYVVVAGVALVAIRPRWAWDLTYGAYKLWRLWRRVDDFIASRLPVR